MKYFIVWSMVKSEDHHGNVVIGWHLVGVFKSAHAESACKAAAKKSQQMGTFFAVEGFPWGIDLMEIEASEFGQEDAIAKLTELERRGADIENQLTRLQQLEVRSREMEREAGIGDGS